MSIICALVHTKFTTGVQPASMEHHSKRRRLEASTDTPVDPEMELLPHTPTADDSHENVEQREESQISGCDDDHADVVDYDLDLNDGNGGYAKSVLPSGLYGCWLLVSVREFKGQSSGKDAGKWGVSGNSPEEFVKNCWLMAENFLKREIIFVCDDNGVAQPSWSTKLQPTEEDFDRFALFNDKSCHRTHTIDKITPTILQNWKNKEIHLLLHVYSLSVNNRAVHKMVKDTLLEPEERDRAGAATNRSVRLLSEKLREKHSNHWQAVDIAWMMWANAIFASDPCLHENLLNEGPPAHLVKLFTAKELPQLRQIRQNFTVAHNVNAGYNDEIVFIRETFNNLEKTVEALTSTLTTQMQFLKRNIEALEARDRFGESFLSAAEEAVTFNESDFGASLAERVSNVRDVDHRD